MKIEKLSYPKLLEHFCTTGAVPSDSRFWQLADMLSRYARLAVEFGYAEEAEQLVDKVEKELTAIIDEFSDLVENPSPEESEPEDLPSIRALRPSGIHKLIEKLPDDYAERWRGAFLGRGAGCTLGAVLEFHPVAEMERWARYFGNEYPPTDYWLRVKQPFEPRYIVGSSEELTRNNMDCIPVDDDTGYTLLGLLILEEYGQEFTHRQIAEAWKKYVPLQAENGSWGCYWGERSFLQNLHAGIPVERAGYLKNPNVQSIGAWTRADSWGYVAPGWPEKAAELAYKDASVNHRRNGVYGCMFFAASIAAAFVVDDPLEALSIGLKEIPKKSLFAQAIKWALDTAANIKNYKDAAAAVGERFKGMFEGHAINNACFTVFGIVIGGKDITRVIGNTIAMGMDNDCTAATAGSIVGAVIGQKNIPEHWYRSFNNRVRSYFNNHAEYLDIDELQTRYEIQAELILNQR